MTTLSDASDAVRRSLSSAARGLVDRETLVDLVGLALVAGEHLLIIGPPGTAKSEAVRRVAHALGGQYFEYLLGRFTEPSELFGPVDLRKLREGRVETETAGMLPEAELAFLDEVFLGSTAILNTLLALLNERIFRRGHTRMQCPLRVCVAAANGLPDDESLAAFADRFLLRLFLEPVGDTQLEALLSGGASLSPPGALDGHAMAAADQLTRAAREADLSTVRPYIAQAVRLLRGAGISMTDRRVVKSQRLVAAAGALAGRAAPTAADLWPILYAIPTSASQSTAREVLRDLLASSENATLSAAAVDASSGPLARAQRIEKEAREVLGKGPAGEGEPADGAQRWKLRLEGIAREIDAGFAPQALPESLARLRAELIACIQASA